MTLTGAWTAAYDSLRRLLVDHVGPLDEARVSAAWQRLCASFGIEGGGGGYVRRQVGRIESRASPASPAAYRAHKWQPAAVDSPTWCDLCGDILWRKKQKVQECQSCKYTSHHECLRLVPATCKGFGSAEGGSGNGGSSGGSSGSAAPALPTPEGQRTPKQLGAAVAAAAHHERDDADSGYGGSGGSLPPQGGGAGARGDSSKQLAVANGSGKHRSSSTLPALGHEDLCKLIRLYNLRCGSSQLLTMPDGGEDATFQGCIQVCISLSQPISMVLSPRPASIYEVLNREGAVSAEASLGSSAAARPLVQPQRLQPRVTTAQVSLPRNAVMSLHVTSEHTAADVVQRLLAKFKITDNPRKFALYEQTLADGAEVKLRKVADAERPLVSFLLWNSAALVQQQQQREAKRFVLTEDSKGDVNWDAFSVPELLNFLRILEREEKDYADEIRQKYVARRLHLETALREARSVATASPLTKIRQ